MTTATHPETAVRIAANHAVTKRLGHWSTSRRFEVRAHRGLAVLDLRSPRIEAGDLHLHVDLDHAVLKLLLPDDVMIDDWDLRRIRRGKVRDWQPPAGASDRRIVITGQLRGGQIRIHRGGMAILSAMCSRAYVEDVRRAHREGGLPTVHDPARTG